MVRGRIITLGLCAALAACTTSGETDAARLIASVHHSEWAEPNRLRLNLETGDYSIAPGRWTDTKNRGQRRAKRLQGALRGQKLDRLRNGFTASFASGLVDEECQNTPRKKRKVILVSNGGTKTLNLFKGGEWRRAHGDLECWTKPALALHAQIEEAFEPVYRETEFDR